MRRQRITSLLPTFILTAVLAGCGDDPAARLSWDQAVAELQVHFHACALDQGSSDLDAECAEVRVPIDWDAPDGQTIVVPIKRLPVTRPRARLWLVEGGPGASGLEDFPPVMRLWQKLDPTLELLTLDHRGVGGAARLVCPQEEAADSVDGKSIARAEIPTCLGHLQGASRDQLGFFTTTQAARDVAALVQRTRTPNVPTFLWGGSYGTYLIQRLLQLFPRHVDGIILDSINPANANTFDQAKGIDEAAQAVLRKCGEQPECQARLGADPVGYWRQLLTDVDRGHCPSAGLDSSGLKAMGTWIAAIHPFRSALPAVAFRLRRCTTQDLQALIDFYSVLSAQALFALPGFSQVLNMNITASEMAWPGDGAFNAQAAAFDQQSLFALAPLVGTYELAAQWPRYTDPLDDQWATTDVPMLLLQGGLDLLTPVAGGRQWRDRFTAAHQTYLEFPDGAHGITWNTPTADSPTGDCAASLTLDFIAAPTATLDTSCAHHVPTLDLVGDPELSLALFGRSSFWD